MSEIKKHSIIAIKHQIKKCVTVVLGLLSNSLYHAAENMACHKIFQIVRDYLFEKI